MERLPVKRKRDLNEIYRRIFKGSMPELYADENVGLGDLLPLLC